MFEHICVHAIRLSLCLNMSVSMPSGCPCYQALDVHEHVCASPQAFNAYEHVCIHAIRLSVLSGS